MIKTPDLWPPKVHTQVPPPQIHIPYIHTHTHILFYNRHNENNIHCKMKQSELLQIPSVGVLLSLEIYQHAKGTMPRECLRITRLQMKIWIAYVLCSIVHHSQDTQTSWVSLKELMYLIIIGYYSFSFTKEENALVWHKDE